MIKAITFDLWNTLFETVSYSDLRLNLLSKYLKKRGIKIPQTSLIELYNNFFNFINPKFKALPQHHVYTKERVFSLFEELDISINSLEVDQIVNGIEAAMLENPPALKKGVKDTISILSQDYKLGIISDTGITPGRIIRIILKKYGILKFFLTTIFSDEIGYYKPHSKVFETALDNLRCQPEHSIHIGDLIETDIKGAKNYNMRAIWISNSLQIDNFDIQPDYKINEISEVIEIVKSII